MKIMLVEDNEAIIMGLEYLLSREGFQVVTIRNAKQTYENLSCNEFDLVLLDIALPDGNGFDICKKIKQEGKTPIIFLTAREEETDIVKGLDMGADDYIIKPFRNRELISRIRNVLRRNGKESTVFRCGDVVLDLQSGIVMRNNAVVAMTKLEYKILSLMIAHPGRLYTREEILANIWDISGNFVNDNTLSVTMKRIREKLRDTDGSIIKTVRGIGYKMEG